MTTRDMSDNVVRRDFWDWFVNTYCQERVTNVVALRDEHDIEEIVKEWETLHPAPKEGERLQGFWAKTVTVEIPAALVDVSQNRDVMDPDDVTTELVYLLPNDERVTIGLDNDRLAILDATPEGASGAVEDLCREVLTRHLLTGAWVLPDGKSALTTGEAFQLTQAITGLVDTPTMSIERACVEIRGLRGRSEETIGRAAAFLVCLADALDLPRDLNQSTALESVRMLRRQLADKERQLRGVPLGTEDLMTTVKEAIGLTQSEYTPKQIAEHIKKLRNNSITLAEVSTALPSNWHVADYASKIRNMRQRMTALENDAKRHEERFQLLDRIATALGLIDPEHPADGVLKEIHRLKTAHNVEVDTFAFITDAVGIQWMASPVLGDITKIETAKRVRQCIRGLVASGTALEAIAKEVGYSGRLAPDVAAPDVNVRHDLIVRAVKARDGFYRRAVAAEAKLAEIAAVTMAFALPAAPDLSVIGDAFAQAMGGMQEAIADAGAMVRNTPPLERRICTRCKGDGEILRPSGVEECTVCVGTGTVPVEDQSDA